MDTLLESIPAPYRPWVLPLLVPALAIVVAILVHAVVYFIADRMTRKTAAVADTALVRHTRSLARVVMALIAIQIALPWLSIPDSAAGVVRHVLSLALIAALTWLTIAALRSVDDVVSRRYPIDVADNLKARMIQTQTRLLSRTLMVVVAIIGLSAMLMTFPRVRQLGQSMLASAGIAGLIVGFAARPTLGNLIAGVQLALTQPIRIDDVVIVEGEWGWIEQIKSTFVVVRIWDQRRLIVPLQYFIEKPFQNWTRRSADILGTVYLYVDYHIPVDEVREELRRIVKDCDKWDGRVCGLQVTNATEKSMELRALVSAANSSAAWDLRCLVREKLIAFLSARYPGCLPRFRVELDQDNHETEVGSEKR